MINSIEFSNDDCNTLKLEHTVNGIRFTINKASFILDEDDECVLDNFINKVSE